MTMGLGQDQVLAALAASGIRQVNCALDGSGDSGDCEIDRVCYASGREEAVLPSTAIGFNCGCTITLRDAVLDLASAAPEGDWVNNAGGHGTVSLFPMELDPHARICCDMEYRSEDEDGFEDEQDDVPVAYAEADIAAALPTIRGEVV